MVASDAIPFDAAGRGHPRGAGCFCRVLVEHVGLGRGRTPAPASAAAPAATPPADEGAAPAGAAFERIPLMLALAKMSLLPARRLQRVCAAFAQKGRLQVLRCGRAPPFSEDAAARR